MRELVIFGIVNLVAAALSGAAGGGGGLISTPFLVVLGLSPATAIATSKFGGFGISAGSSARFFKERVTDKKTVIAFSIMSSFGAIIGSVALLEFSNYEEALEQVMGLVILLAGIPLLYMRNMGLKARTTSPAMKLLGTVLLMIGVSLQAALSAGVGMLQLIILVGCFGMTAMVASATRRAMQLVVATISLGIFMYAGIVDYRFGVVALATSFLGGFIGTHIAIKKGNKFILNLFAVISAILAIQLIF